MARIHSIHFEEIHIAEDRQRKEFDPESIVELAGSISQSTLLHPPVLRTDADGRKVLVAGERRIRAMEYLWNFGEKVRCGGSDFPEWYIPYLDIGEIDPLDAEEAELDENIRRKDLTWQELARAQARLLRLRTQQALRDGTAVPTQQDIVEEVAKAKGIQPVGDIRTQVRENLILARNLDNKEVAAAPDARSAMKILKRQEEATRNEALAISVGRTHSSASHTLLQGDCLELLAGISDSTFDVILSDPPYGMGADDFNNSGGAAGGGTSGGHFYADDYETWAALMAAFLPETSRVTKPLAHLYLFCDIDRFTELRAWSSAVGWRVFRTPLIWHNPTANRAPWPEHGPHRKYQCILFAIKGQKPVTKLYPDVITFPSDPNLGHHAQKPVALYTDLLRRSVSPGDSVLDPFAGSGPIFPAAHGLKCLATGIEMNGAAAGIALKRLGQLK